MKIVLYARNPDRQEICTVLVITTVVADYDERSKSQGKQRAIYSWATNTHVKLQAELAFCINRV